MKNKWQDEKTLAEKLVDGAAGENPKKLDLKKESKAKLYAGLDFNYRQLLLETSDKGSSYGAAGCIRLREKPLYVSGFDLAVERFANPLGSIFNRLSGNRSFGLPCDLGLMR